MSNASYYTLLASLPALPPNFESADRPPISDARLEQRLKMLSADDARVIQQATDFLAWDRQPLDRTDEDVCRTYARIMTQVNNPLLLEVITTRMDIRTIVSGLRRRRLQQAPPPGVGEIAKHINKHWKHPDFRLALRFPWLSEADRLLNGSTPIELETLLLRISWNEWKRRADQYQFTFEAVILYLCRLAVLYRWTQRDSNAGREKFEQLVTEALGDYANLYQ